MESGVLQAEKRENIQDGKQARNKTQLKTLPGVAQLKAGGAANHENKHRVMRV
jgi:hypothetical protein